LWSKPRHNIALKETLPLIAYPVTFHILCCFGFADRIEMAITNSPLYGLWLLHAIAVSSPGVFASLFVVMHMCILRKHVRENAYMQTVTQNLLSQLRTSLMFLIQWNYIVSSHYTIRCNKIYICREFWKV